MASPKRYFSHDNDSHLDEKILDLRQDLGWEGYGIFWGIVELLHQNSGTMQMHCKRIAFALQTDSKIIDSIINNYGLFVVNQESNEFYSERLLRNLEKQADITEARKNAAQARWKGNDNANALQTDTNAMQTDANKIKSNQIEIKLKEEEREKEKMSPVGSLSHSPSLDFKPEPVLEKKEKPPKVARKPPPQTTYFEQSGIYLLEDFITAFADTEYARFDLKFYHEEVLIWTQKKQPRYVDWKAVSMGFMRKSEQEGKAKFKNDANRTNNNQQHQFSGGQGATAKPAKKLAIIDRNEFIDYLQNKGKEDSGM